MALALKKAFVDTITNGLLAKTTTTCSRWALRYRVMSAGSFKGPWSFKHYPWLRKMHDTNSMFCVGKKAAQMGFTETVLNRAFFALDQEKKDVLYVLPSARPDATVFSASRFNVALESSPYIRSMFKNTNNVDLKRAGVQSLYIRGSRSRASMKSIPCSLIVLDEFAEMDPEVLPLVKERMSGNLEKMLWAISTPCVPNQDIDALYAQSNQQIFCFVCPNCHRHTELIFPECLKITGEDFADPNLRNSFLVCKECQGRLDHEAKVDWLAEGYWKALNPSSDIDGYYINQLYSPTITPYDLATAYMLSLRDAAEEQEFWNNKVGVAHLVSGGSVTEEQLLRSMRDYVMSDPRYLGQGYATTMGIDVGGTIHYEIDQYQIDRTLPTTDMNTAAKCRVLKVGTVKDFEELRAIIFNHEVQRFVIDDMPDTRAALAFVRTFPPGMGSLNHYGANSTSGKEIIVHGTERITTNRTVWLDVALGRFINSTIFTPKDTPEMYRQHMKAIVKIYRKSKDTGETVSEYRRAGSDDHWAHARCYSEIAYKLLMHNAGGVESITERIL